MSGPLAFGEGRPQAGQPSALPLSLPSVAPQHVAPMNAFHRPSRPMSFRLAGNDARLAIVADPPCPAGDDIVLSLTVDGRPGELVLPARLVDTLLRKADPGLTTGALAAEHAALVLEYVVESAVTAIEAVAGRRIVFRSIAAPDPALSGQPMLGFALASTELGDCAIGLRLMPSDTAALLSIRDKTLGRTGPDHGVRFPVHLRLAGATVTRSELATLAPGDVILADGNAKLGRAVAVIAEHLAIEVESTAAGATVAGRPERIAAKWEWCRIMPEQSSSSEPENVADLGELPVRLVFELGRLELSFSEIRDLAPGTVLPLARPLEESLDIVANGRRIGRGSLVRIGDSVGVRVTRLLAHD